MHRGKHKLKDHLLMLAGCSGSERMARIRSPLLIDYRAFKLHPAFARLGRYVLFRLSRIAWR